MIIVTGGAGFIGSNIVKELNRRGRRDILIVDDLKDGLNYKNLRGLQFVDYQHKDDFFSLLRMTTSTARILTPSSMRVPAQIPWSMMSIL